LGHKIIEAVSKDQSLPLHEILFSFFNSLKKLLCNFFKELKKENIFWWPGPKPVFRDRLNY